MFYLYSAILPVGRQENGKNKIIILVTRKALLNIYGEIFPIKLGYAPTGCNIGLKPATGL